MRDFRYVDPESNGFKQFLSLRHRVRKGLSANDLTRRLVCNTEQQVAPAFVRQRHAVLAKLMKVELVLRFFEFESLVLGWHRAPSINLFSRDFHLTRFYELPSALCEWEVDCYAAF